MDAKAHDISHTHGIQNQRYMDTRLITHNYYYFLYYYYSLYVYKQARMDINEIKVKTKLLDALLFFKLINVFTSNQFYTIS